jgi:hypothetical protein
MAASAFGKRSIKTSVGKEAKVVIEAYEMVLASSGIASELKINDVVSTSSRGVEQHSATLTLKWLKEDEKKGRTKSDEVVIEMDGGVLVDLENSKLHRITRKSLQGYLEMALQTLLQKVDEPTPLYKEAELCLRRFYPNRQEPVECLSIIGQSAFTAKKCYIRATFEPKDVIDELMAGKKGHACLQGVSIKLSVTTNAVPISSPIFKALKVYGTSKTPEEHSALYAKLCKNPKISPTEIYNSILATAYIEKPTIPAAIQAVQSVLSMSRF